MKVFEIFRSLQGEGTQAGRPCVFVRLAGCNLRCSWCDTPGARDPASGADRDWRDVLGEVLAFRPPLACLTGGEPLLQDEAADLVRALLDRGVPVQVFTNGSRDLSVLPPGTCRVVDVKTPWVHRPDLPWEPGDPPPPPPHLRPGNVACLGPDDEVKFVVRDRREFRWALAWSDASRIWDRVAAVFATPAFGALEPAEIADWVLESGRPIRLGLQWHKVIWGPGTTR